MSKLFLSHVIMLKSGQLWRNWTTTTRRALRQHLLASMHLF